MSRWISDIYIRARMKQNPLLQGNCEYELWKQFVDQLVDAMPSVEITRCRDCKWNSECRMLDDDNGYCSQADRKTENSSEKPNNCEHITEDGVTCAKYPACDDCLDNPLNKVKGSERLVKG